MTPLTIALLPGLDGTGDLFQPFVSTAPPQFSPLIIRLPPLGGYEDLIEHVRPQLPANENFVVLGESFSGPLAIAVARNEPRRVAAVILCNSFVSPPVTSLLRFLPWSMLFAVPPPRWVLRRCLIGTAASNELVASVRAAVAKTPRKVLAARMRSVFELSNTSTMTRLEIPMLILSGAQDRLVRPNHHALRGLTSAVRTKTIAGPHLLLQAAPRQAWSEISAFLASSRLTPV